MPLHKDIRKKLDLDKYFNWLEKQEGKNMIWGNSFPVLLISLVL